MSNSRLLGQITKEFIPEYFNRINWYDIWDRKLENGTAFEWMIFSAFLKVAKDNGWQISLPILDSFNARDYYILRNEIPFQYGSQAGNSSTSLHKTPLHDRFFFSLVPKATIRKGHNIISIFREGCPIHRIMANQDYIDRPDIIMIPGCLREGYPVFDCNKTEVIFEYDYDNTIIKGVLRVSNSPYLPCKERMPRGGLNIDVKGIIECSVNKSIEIADPQLRKYESLFSSDDLNPPIHIITGNDLTNIQWYNSIVNLFLNNQSSIMLECLNAVRTTFKVFSLS